AEVDVVSDGRMMVPVFYDLQRRKMKVWVFLGWRTTEVDVTYRTSPVVLAVEEANPNPGRRHPRSARDVPEVLFSSARYTLATPVVAGVLVPRLRDRDDFRRHCDGWKTRRAILANLK